MASGHPSSTKIATSIAFLPTVLRNGDLQSTAALSAFSYLRISEESKIFLPITPKSRISEPTLPEEMYDQWHKGGYMNNPWSAPGSAKLYGGSCGANGGNPNGCGMGMLM